MTESSTRPATLPAQPDPAHLARREFEVSGMTCGACSSRVQRVLSKLDGVQDAAVNLATHRATVQFDPALVGPAELTAVVTKAGYGFTPRSDRPESVATAARTMEQHEREEQQRWLRRLLVALPITVVVLGLALKHPADPRWGWVPALLTVPVQFWAGWTFLRGAWARALNLSANMDTLVALGTITAFTWSFVELVTPGVLAASTGHVQHEGHLHFEMVCLIITALLLGKWFESRAKAEAGHAARALAELAPESAVRLDAAQDGEGTQVRVEEVLPGDLVLVRPGDRVAIDGVVVDGLSTVDESLLTGESAPVEKAAGAAVTGGTVNLSGRLVVRTTRVGAESTLSRLVDLVEQAQGAKAPLQRLADRIAGLFVPVVLVLAAVTALVWTLLDQPATGVLSAVAVLIVACPCALGLATPVALMVAGGRGSTLGVVLRNPEALELNSRIDTVVFDKTGVLTSGVMAVTEQWVRPGENAAVALARTAAAEAATEHPAGTAILRHARAVDLVLPVASAFEAVPGRGVRAAVEEFDVRVGKPVAAGLPDGAAGVQVVDDVVPLDPALAELVAGWQAHGHTTVFATWDGQVQAAFAIADRPRPEAADVIRELHALGLRTALLTGDNLPTARSVAAAVGIDDVLADVLPADKDARIAELQSRGHVVAMVGDGINDAAALARADLGIAVGSGTDVAARASDVVLLGDNLHGVPRAVRLARQTFRVILQNLGWAFGYNLIAIPLAATGLLSPALAGVAMGMSSICVVGNSLTLTRFDRRPVAARDAAGGMAPVGAAGPAGDGAPVRVARPPSRFSVSVLAAWLAPALLLGGLLLANPARYLGAPTVDRTFTLAQDTVQLSIGPLKAGEVPLHLYAFSPQGGLDATLLPTVQAHPTKGSGPTVTAILVPAGPGHLSGTIPLTRGTWDLVITDPASGDVRHEVLVQVS